MKNLIFLFFSFSVSAQISEFKNNFRGNVKSMEIREMNSESPPQERISFTEFDRQKRKIKETSGYGSREEFFYKTTSDKEYSLNQSFDEATNKLQSFTAKERDQNNQILLEGTKNNNDWGSFYINTHQKNYSYEKHFYISEISLITEKKSIDLSTRQISPELVPFDWDKNLSKAYETFKTDFPDEEKDHQFHFEFYEKGNPSKKIIYYYNANDSNDPGKGSWYLYENNLLKEERYIYKGEDISDFGHRFSYDKNGNKTSDIYGYFNKMPQVFMTKYTYSYNEKGDLAKEISESDSKNSKPNIVQYIYTYDTSGNWTSVKSIYDDGSGQTIRRKFSYYKDSEESVKNSLSEKDYNESLKIIRQRKPILEQNYAKYLEKKKSWTKNPIAEKDSRNMKSKNWKDFLPARQILDTIVTGDLNKDGVDDLAMVFTQEKLMDSERNVPRTIRILFRDTEGNYKMITESKTAIATEGNGNIFFQGMNIAKGVLRVQHEFIRGGCEHIYRYQNGGFFLIGGSKINGDASYTSKVDYNLSTGKYIYEYTTDSEDQKSEKKEGVQKLKILPNIETHELFSLEIAGQNL